jgi:hypothetical protein
VTNFRRFRFSLVTLLIATAWSAVVVWINITPLGHTHSSYNGQDFEGHHYGWPYTYGWTGHEHPDNPHLRYGWDGRMLPPSPNHEESSIRIVSYPNLPADAAAGVLLVVVLTWGSNQLLRRVGARLRRHTVSCLNKQASDSQVE